LRCGRGGRKNEGRMSRRPRQPWSAFVWLAGVLAIVASLLPLGAVATGIDRLLPLAGEHVHAQPGAAHDARVAVESLQARDGAGDEAAWASSSCDCCTSASAPCGGCSGDGPCRDCPSNCPGCHAHGSMRGAPVSPPQLVLAAGPGRLIAPLAGRLVAPQPDLTAPYRPPRAPLAVV
jgi:hypothetical protein